MKSALAGRVLRLLAAVAMVVQLGVVAFHHHDTLGSHGVGHGHEGHTLVSLTDHAGHDHHDHDDHDAPHDTHHGPDDNDEHDCDSCFLKSVVSSQLLPEAVTTLLAPPMATRRQLTASQEKPRQKIGWRYQARAPPLQATVS